MTFIIEIMGDEITAFKKDGEAITPDFNNYQDLADCATSGDCEPACNYVRDQLRPSWRCVGVNPETGEVENRAATDSDLESCARAIYFESLSDFTDSDLCKTYLIWEVAHQITCN